MRRQVTWAVVLVLAGWIPGAWAQHALGTVGTRASLAPLDDQTLARGACCMPDGECEFVFPIVCALAHGEFHEGVPCSEVTCVPQPTGACCVPLISYCEDGKYEFECLLGDWYEGMTCDEIDCAPTGACCLTSLGICYDDVTELLCLGEWTEGADCEDDRIECEAEPGACCDVRTGECTELLLVDCIAACGWNIWHPGTCAENWCEPIIGACCNPESGECCETFWFLCCDGDWYPGQTCEEIICGVELPPRGSPDHKGSVLVYPKIELRWTPAGNLLQDTFLALDNDALEDVHVVAYFVNELGDILYRDFDLTAGQPTYWSAAWGLGTHFVTPFFGFDNAYDDPEGSTDKVMRGYAVVFAADAYDRLIRWNHLYGQATLVNYANGTAWEYSAYGLQKLEADELADGVILLNGIALEAGFDHLLLDFIATGAEGFSSPEAGVVLHDTDLTLLVLDQDFRQENDRPFVTKAVFNIWNENEDSLSDEYCLVQWDQRLLGRRPAFTVEMVGTSKARAIIEGVRSPLCDVFDPISGVLHTAEDRALVGVAAKLLTFESGLQAVAGTHLQGSGARPATMYYDYREPTPEFRK